MKKIFVSGSRSITSLPTIVMLYLDELIRDNTRILVGDCDGVDTFVQKYLRSLGYTNVCVYTSGSQPRNFYGINRWDTVCINAEKGEDEREYYAIKDIKMTNDCDEGLALWDGKSRATNANIERLKASGKAVTIFKIQEVFKNGERFYNVERG